MVCCRQDGDEQPCLVSPEEKFSWLALLRSVVVAGAESESRMAIVRYAPALGELRGLAPFAMALDFGHPVRLSQSHVNRVAGPVPPRSYVLSVAEPGRSKPSQTPVPDLRKRRKLLRFTDVLPGDASQQVDLALLRDRLQLLERG